MSAAHDQADSQPTKLWDKQEAFIERFEAAWLAGRRPAIDDFLPHEAADRQAVLVELIHADLECRLKAGEEVSVDNYLRRYPELATDTGVRQELLAAADELARRRQAARACPAPAAERPAEAEAETLAGPAAEETRQAESLPAPSPMPFLAGAFPGWPELPGYQILGELGRGGMGVVFKARHRLLERLVAIKMPLGHQVTETADRERFLREARAAARLRHAHICPIHEVGEHQQRPYLVMGFIQGQTLRDWGKEKAPSPRQAAEMVAGLARAVGYAHDHGVIHRDIKPGNVMVEADTGKPVLMDFGLAKELSEQAVHMTHTGQIMGTPAYMAPEQAAGRVRDIGPATDVYALGVVLYELLCRQLPFQGSVGEVIKQVQTEEPPPPRRLVPRLHRDLETICLRALAKEPQRRYPSAAALADDLERFLAGEAILARREGMPARLWRKVKRRPVALASILIGLAGLAAGAYFAVNALRTSDQVDRASRQRIKELDEVHQGLDRGLATPQWTEAYLRQMEALLARLERLAPEQVGPARARSSQRLAASIREGFSFARKPVLYSQDIRAIRSALALLKARAPELARGVRKEFEKRIGAEQRVIVLRPPFDLAQDLFGPGLKVVDGTLARVAGPGKNLPAVLLTRVPCLGTGELKAVFHPSWADAGQVGLLLNAAGTSSYAFLLSLAPAFASPTGKVRAAASFEAARRQGADIWIQIFRNGVVLREERVLASDLFAGCAANQGALRLDARREGDRLVFQVNGRPPLEFRDVFPLARTGCFGLHWPEKVRLQRLDAWSQTQPGAASPLEKGDAFHAQARYDEALAEYQTQANASRDATIRWESRYKEACCLVELKSVAEAERILQGVSLQAARALSAAARRWSARADVQLWLLYLRQKRAREAAGILKKLDAAVGADDKGLVPLLAEQDLMALVQHYPYHNNTVLFLSRPAEETARNAEQVTQVWGLLSPRPRTIHLTAAHYWSKIILIKAQFFAGHLDAGLRTAEEIINEYGFQTPAIEPYCWLLRARGQSGKALKVLEEAKGNALQVERCRVHAARKEWPQAEAALKAFFEQHQKRPAHYHYFSAACLMQGFIEEQRGRKDAAQAVWRRGLLKNWSHGSRSPAPVPRQLLAANSAPIQDWILASLTGELSDAKAQEISGWLLAPSGELLLFKKLNRLIAVPPAALREAWQTPRGRDWARRMAFRDLRYADFLRVPAFLLVAETLHHQALPGPLTREQDDVLWQLVENTYTAWIDRKIGISDFLALAFVWKGEPDLFGLGWSNVSPRLPRQIAGPLAYVIGRRYLVLKKPKQAGDFFRFALKDAPAKSPLQRLAQVELKRMKAK